MAQYLLLWEHDNTRIPEDLEKRKAQHQGFQDIVRQQMKTGEISQWGGYAGETKGFCIVEGSAEDVHKLTGRWVPWVSFQTREVLSIEQVIKATAAM
ncbi:MAG: hypothetical protein IT165_32665 [Bryobacterales bacterium]|nr:hypothetical protein [Bryobacterales bacterium]